MKLPQINTTGNPQGTLTTAAFNEVFGWTTLPFYLTTKLRSLDYGNNPHQQEADRPQGGFGVESAAADCFTTLETKL
jgi:hypothetical protein